MISFLGTGITVLGVASPGSGNVTVVLDGKTTIPPHNMLEANFRTNATMYQVLGLTNDTHTVQLINGAGRMYFDVAIIEIAR